MCDANVIPYISLATIKTKRTTFLYKSISQISKLRLEKPNFICMWIESASSNDDQSAYNLTPVADNLSITLLNIDRTNIV